jgi:hypothetical protein
MVSRTCGSISDATKGSHGGDWKTDKRIELQQSSPLRMRAEIEQFHDVTVQTLGHRYVTRSLRGILC